MTGIEKIKGRIIADSSQKAANIVEEAKKQAEAILEKAKKQAQTRGEEIFRKAQQEASEKKRIAGSMLELEMRKHLLQTKQSLIEDVFDGVLEKLAGMSPEAYREAIGPMLLNALGDEEVEVVVSEKDKDILHSDFIAGINEQALAQNKRGRATLSQETRNIAGGFILKCHGIEINNSFEALIKMQRDEVEPKVAELLFQ